jgi:hypothetical protein
MADQIERIKELARKIWGEGEYTVDKRKGEAVLLNAAGEQLYRAANFVDLDHVAELERRLRRKAEANG